LSELLPKAERWAQEILLCAPLAVQASKQASTMGLDLPLEAAINNQYYAFQQMLFSKDAMEGPKAFAEKRRPVWKGR